MLPLLLVIAPALLGVASFYARDARRALAILLATAALHLVATATLWLPPLRLEPGPLIGLDPIGLIFLTTTSVIFFAAAVYSIPYLLHGTHDPAAPPHRFVPYLLWFLSAMTLVTVTRHLALLWAAVEATTLATAPLIYFYRRPEALEAAWKYLLLCSVGIALALLGVIFLGIASSSVPGHPPSRSRGSRRSPPGCRDRGSRPRSCSRWWATAPRWGWCRSTPGCPTPTARRPR